MDLSTEVPAHQGPAYIRPIAQVKCTGLRTLVAMMENISVASRGVGRQVMPQDVGICIRRMRARRGDDTITSLGERNGVWLPKRLSS
jgi:hypothetical protein